MSIKNIVKKLANIFGYDIRKLHGATCLRTTISESYSLLYGLGFRPKTIVDVGIANGTSELYAAFPNSYFLLIEPLRKFEPQLKSILKHHQGSYVIAAAGSRSGNAVFNVHPNRMDASSLYKETMGSEEDGYEIIVPMICLDEILSQKNLLGPYLIKVDVQGAELDVLEGGKKALKDTEVIVLEVSMFQFMKGAPEFHDVIFYMKKHGLVAYDIILGLNRPFDNALGQIDIVFVKENGQFRQNHSYATKEQMK